MLPVPVVAGGAVEDAVAGDEAGELVDWTVAVGEVFGAVVHVAKASAASTAMTARVTAGRFIRRIVQSSPRSREAEFL